MQLTKYVLGFMFDENLEQVVLIQKARPDWQEGLLNGTGGHIETHDVSSLAAMMREHQQETGIATSAGQWIHYGVIGDDHTFEVDLFAARTDLALSARTTTDEPVIISVVRNLCLADCIENLPWLIHLAIDCLQDGRPAFAKITYPAKA